MGWGAGWSDMGGRLLCWKRERQAGAAVLSLAHLDGAAVELDDLLGERQADPGAFVLVATVESLEDDEHLVGVLRRDSDPVVGHVHPDQVALRRGRHPQRRRHLG